MSLEKIKSQLAKDFTQRIIYGIGLALWTYLMWDRITEFPYSTSSVGLSYMTLFTIPALLLAFQIVRNNVILWAIIFGIVTIYIVAASYLTIADAITRSGNRVKAIDWIIKDAILLLVGFGVLFVADWIIYMIKPKRLI